MVVYLLREYAEDLHSVLAVYQSVDAAIASCKGIALQNGLDVESVDTAGVIVEYSNEQYNSIVWVESMSVIEEIEEHV